jgi:hypothetical protein
VGYQQVKDLVVINRFEDMILNPLDTAISMVKGASVDYENYFSQIQKWSFRVQDQNNKHFQEAACSKPYSRNDHIKKVGRWKQNLTREEVNEILPYISEGSELFGYDLGEL